MIHKFKKNNKNIVLDVESGSVFDVDELVYNLLGEDGILDSAEGYPGDEVNEAKEEIQELIDQDLLYTNPADADVNPFDARRGDIKALCLHVSHDCNLRCSYCFASQGDFHGEREVMSFETGKKAIDFVIANSGKRRNIEVDFFGGEPLMNFEVVKQIYAYAKSVEKEAGKEFHFTMTTNGLLLNDENMQWLDEHMDNIVLSLDGRETVNDHMRKTVSGEGSYQYIHDKILKMAKMREGKKDYYVRGTFTANNLDFTEDVLSLADDGFKSISVEPVVAKKDESYALLDCHLDEVQKEYDKLAKAYLERRKKPEESFGFFHFNLNLDGGPCLYKRLSGCGAGSDYLAITPFGEIYPCHQFVGNEDFRLGSLDTGIEREDIRAKFRQASLIDKESCKQCWAKYFCGGGCHANAYNFNEDLTKPYQMACEMERARVENALMIYLVEQDS